MKVYFNICLGLCILTIACKKVDKLTQFEMEYEETVIIPASAGVNLPFNVQTPEVETNSESTFAVNDTRKDRVEQIILKEMILTITSPSGEDFSFLQSIQVYINADGLNESKIAWKENINSTSTILTLDITGVDLQEYIKKDSFSLRLNTVTDEVLATDHHVKVYSKFFVDAKVLGV